MKKSEFLRETRHRGLSSRLLPGGMKQGCVAAATLFLLFFSGKVVMADKPEAVSKQHQPWGSYPYWGYPYGGYGGGGGGYGGGGRPPVNTPCNTCGNGIVEDPEQCDDGNLVSGDG